MEGMRKLDKKKQQKSCLGKDAPPKADVAGMYFPRNEGGKS